MKKWTLVASLLALGLAETPGLAQTHGERMTARDIAQEGLNALDEGDYATAERKLAAAYSVVKVPTLALFRARALVHLGRLVEASELYREATVLELEGTQRAAQESAQEAARAERATLLPRIPRLTVTFLGATSNQAQCEVAGVEVSSLLLEAGHAVDPGEYLLSCHAGGESREEQVALNEGERETVTLDFTPNKELGTEPRSASLPAPPLATQEPEATTESPGSWQTPTGWTVLGVGGAALLVGTIAGIHTLQKRDELLDAGCTDAGQCDDSLRSDVDSHTQTRRLAIVGIAAGGILISTGAALVLTAPRRRPHARLVTPWIGYRMGGVRGRF